MSLVTDKWGTDEIKVIDNVVGWNLDDEHRPFDEKKMQELVEMGVVGQVEVEATAIAYEKHMTAAIAGYIQRQNDFWTKPEYEDARNEQMFEMRAAFGPGVEVVNVFTGRKHTT